MALRRMMISTMRLRRFLLPCALSLAWLTFGCTNPFVSPWREEVAHVVEFEPGDFWQAPSQAAVGAEVRIQVRSSGTPDCDRISRTEVHWDSATSLTITPYNESKIGRAGVCNYSAKFFHHSATLRFSRPGSYEIRLRARSRQRGEVVVIASRTILVR